MGKMVRVSNKDHARLKALRLGGMGAETLGDVITRLLDKEEETPHAKGVKRPRAERPEAEEVR